MLTGIAALYLFLWLLLPKPAFWGIDSGIKYQGARSFAETGQIAIPFKGADLGIDPKSRTLPGPFTVISGKDQVPVFSPLFLVIGGSLYKLFGNYGLFLLPLLGGWLTLIAAWRLWVAQREAHDGRLYLLLLAVGSPIFFYSLELWEHTVAAGLLTLALAVLFPDRDSGNRPGRHSGALPAGLLTGFAAGFRSEVAFMVVLTLIFWRQTGRSSRSAMRYVFGVVGATIFVGLINYWQTSVPHPLHVVSNLIAYSPDNFGDMLVTRAQNLYILILQGFDSNLLSVIGLVPIGLTVFWSGWRREKGWWHYIVAGLAGSSAIYLTAHFRAENLVGYTSVSNGFLWIMPVVGFAIMPLSGERRRFWKFLWASYLLMFLSIALFSPSLKGVHWGPRLAVIVMPVILIIAAVRIQRWYDRYESARPVIWFIVSVTILIQIAGFGLQVKARHDNLNINRWLAVGSGEAVVSRLWWLGGDCSLVSYATPWVTLNKPSNIAKTITSFRTAGVKEFSYIEFPPYSPESGWQEAGANLIKTDFFHNGRNDLKRSRLAIIR